MKEFLIGVSCVVATHAYINKQNYSDLRKDQGALLFCSGVAGYFAAYAAFSLLNATKDLINGNSSNCQKLFVLGAATTTAAYAAHQFHKVEGNRAAIRRI